MTQDEPRRFAADSIHMMRTTVLAQYQLSAMADNKASLLLGATFVVFTISMSQAANHGGVPPVPLLILAAASMLSALCAAAAVLPKVGRAPRGNRNLMFFGGFADMAEDDYVEAMLERAELQETVLATMARDIHQNGRVLATKKYRLLRYAYLMFIFGLVASVLAFVAVLIF